MRIAVPRTILRYISGQFITTLALTLAIVTAAWVMVSGIATIRHQVVGPREFLAALPFLAVISLKYTLPMAVLFATSIAYGRMSSENEIRAMEWHGLHIGWIILPAAVIAVAASAVSLELNCQLIPSARRALGRVVRANVMEIINRQLFNAAQRSEPIGIGRFTINLKAYDQSTNTVQGITVIQTNAERQPIRRIDAASAKIVPGKVAGAVLIAPDESRGEADPRYVTFLLAGGLVSEFDPRTGMITETFAAPPVSIDIPPEESDDVQAKYLASDELAEFAQSAEKEADRFRGRSDYYERIALGTSPFFFVLLAAPIAMARRWKHMLTAFVPSLAVVLVVYYPLVMWAKVAARSGRIDPMYGMFAGNAALLALGAAAVIYLVRR